MTSIIEQHMAVTVQVLYKLRQPILLAACRLYLHNEMKSEVPRYGDVYIRLSSVCKYFREVVSDTQVRQFMRHTLKGLSIRKSTGVSEN